MCQKVKMLLDVTFSRFLIVGVINTIIGTSTMLICYDIFTLGYWISTGMNYVVGSMFSYVANKLFTFKSSKYSFREMARFVINVVTCYFLAYGMARQFVALVLKEIFSCVNCDILLLDHIAMLVGMGTFVILNYNGQRLWVFR